MPRDDDEREEFAPRPFWSGTISFGLVAIPVDVYPAHRPARDSLRMLAPDGTPLARRYACPAEDRELSPEEIVRGYEVGDGRFVVVTDEELEALAPEKTRDIDLRRFVDAAGIDPRWLIRSYYLTPAGDSNKAYRLLARVMEETGRAGIATFVMRGKEYLVAIVAEGGILRAETLRFPDELRDPAEVPVPEGEPDRRLVRAMEAAIARRMAKGASLEEAEDPRAARLAELVERKVRRGEDVVGAPGAEEGAGGEREAPVVDLMAVLKERLGRAEAA